ncbi:MAG: RNA polymerase sigma factor [Planctomycetota bacterium]|jgi:RNA polymerase sigma-70 factor (ECF subfamily)
MTERSDVALMLSFQEGDQEAFSVLVDRHRNAIVNLTYRYLGNRSDAEDLAQEVFLRVYRARARYRPEAKFTTWLYRVAVNACLNEVRDRKNRPTFGAASLAGGDDEGFAPSVADERTESPVHAAERSELRERVRAAVDELPDRQRVALLLNKFHGLSYEDLAASMDLTIPAVKSLLVRARENVRRLIEPHLQSGVDPIPERGRGTA